MRIVTQDRLKAIIDMPAAIAAVRQGLIDVSNGLIEQPEPMQFLFSGTSGELFGDCHLKGARADGRPYFVVKLATGFYQNPQKGLPVNDGLVLVICADTGRPIAMLQDKGWLTQMRTAAAGALAASLKPVGTDAVLGIVGTGIQARLQADAVRAEMGITRLVVCGRSAVNVKAYAAEKEACGFDVRIAPNMRNLCSIADIVVTTTSATTPVLQETDLSGDLHIVALGADSPGKVELAPEILRRADIIVTDSHTQCLHHGDFGAAVRSGCVTPTIDHSLCDLLAGKVTTIDFAAARLSIVDLTGLGAQDLAIASAAVALLENNS